MVPAELLQDYLIDQETGLKELLTWFLNQVIIGINEEWLTGRKYLSWGEE